MQSSASSVEPDPFDFAKSRVNLAGSTRRARDLVALLSSFLSFGVVASSRATPGPRPLLSPSADHTNISVRIDH